PTRSTRNGAGASAGVMPISLIPWSTSYSPAIVETTAPGSATRLTWRELDDGCVADAVMARTAMRASNGTNGPILGDAASSVRVGPLRRSRTCDVRPGRPDSRSDAMNAPVIDQLKLQSFVMQAVGDLASAYSGAMVSLGSKLGLYKALAGAGP